ncbi:ubiquitin-conjugating enzyme E2 variant 3 [Callorhinchus milii]|uniref:ubiquitin-conjugating enzyme E2 variant 3 n=1 Tax=Callorhinchus milii TaxID=7868 RepID=UPI001C3F5E0B|nr:ubiquitin-conjugating enzyme E2 variant 3 [Callorhinchus milii]
MEFNQQILKKRLEKYKFRDLTIEELKNVHKKYPEFRFSMDKYTFNDGSQRDLLNLLGTVPVTYQGFSYNIPVRLWILDSHPFGPPLCFLRPTPDMVIREGKHVDVQGRVYLPGLQHWSHPKSDVVSLLNEMSLTFGNEPPLFSKPSTDGRSVTELSAILAEVTTGISGTSLQTKEPSPHLPPYSKVTVLGSGDLAMACVTSILAKEIVERLVFIQTSENTLRGGSLELEIFSLPRVDSSKDMSASAGSNVVVVTANTLGKEGSYVNVLQSNVELFRSLIPSAVMYSPHCVLVIASQPVDVMSFVAWKLSGFAPQRVLGTGCNLDTQRLRYLLRPLCQPPAHQPWLIGEHGENQVAVLRGPGRDGTPDLTADHQTYEEAARRAVQGLKEKGQRSWCVGLSVADLTETILSQHGRPHSVCTLAQGYHGVGSEVYLSLPCLLGGFGVLEVTALELTQEEEEKLQNSATTLRNLLQQLTL